MQNPELKGRSFVEPSEGWIMPRQNIDGHDIVRYFSILFADSQGAMLMVKSRNFDGSLHKNLKPLIDEGNKIGYDLKDKSHFFYPKGGSLFMDYKIMRSNWYKSLILQQGVQPEDIDKQFSESMTAEQFFSTARSLVETWWDVPIPIHARF
ncbi:MAG: hypothetical protein V1917_01785 [Candidatus Gottesmanbacteria bacterium]